MIGFEPSDSGKHANYDEGDVELTEISCENINSSILQSLPTAIAITEAAAAAANTSLPFTGIVYGADDDGDAILLKDEINVYNNQPTQANANNNNSQTVTPQPQKANPISWIKKNKIKILICLIVFIVLISLIIWKSTTPSTDTSTLGTSPTLRPSLNPTNGPSLGPTIRPSLDPTTKPSLNPTLRPSSNPSKRPSSSPSGVPTTMSPTNTPSNIVTSKPSYSPTMKKLVEGSVCIPTPSPLNPTCLSGICKDRCCINGYEKNCNSCRDDGKCLSCADGFFENNGICESTLNPGQSCSAPSSCKSGICKNGYCCDTTGALSTCMSCSQNSGFCNGCSSGFYLDQNNFQCRSLLANGESCSSSTPFMCASNSCKSRCCTGDGNASECISCGANGECIECIRSHIAVSGKCVQKSLNDFHEACKSNSNARSSDCVAAAHRWCEANGKGGAGVPVETGDNILGISCFTPSSYVGASLTTLQGLNPGCSSIHNSQKGSCITASSNWCDSNGYGRGAISQEVGETGFGVACFNPTTYKEVELVALVVIVPTCIYFDSMDCFSAARRYCINNNKGTSGIPQAAYTKYNSLPVPIIKVACFDANYHGNVPILRT